MFPVAHGWLLAQVKGEPSLAEYLGCVWPDMLFGSPLTHPQSHKSGAKLLAFARGLPSGPERDEFTAFARGVLTHGSEPHGFDWFSDEAYGADGADGARARGYAFQRGAPLATRAAAACGLPEDQGLWKAHNLIEMAFERWCFEANPLAARRLATACADTDLMARIAAPLASFFDADRTALADSMRRYAEVVTLTPTSLDALGQTYALQTRIKHTNAQPSASAIADLIGEAEELVADERDEYLGVCHTGVRVTLAGATAD